MPATARPLQKTQAILLLSMLPVAALAQNGPVFVPDIPVARQGAPLAMPWAGGMNAPHFSSIDLNQDGLQDLFALDRVGNRPLFFLNTGTPGQARYTITRAYDQVYPFPLLHDWALLRDYNCDGKPDIIAYTNAAFAVYRNTSDANGLSFTLAYDMVGSNYVPTHSPNLYISNIDLPGMADVDGDGDLDVLTYSIWGNYLEYHKNLGMELYGTCDSLVYEVRSRCWGEYVESLTGSNIVLNVPCQFNVPNPELGPGGPGHQEQGAGSRAHSGTTVLPLDLNGDGLTDLLLSDLSNPHLTALTNGGSTTHAVMTSKDTLFPSYNVTVNMQQFLGASHVDVDGDGKRDLIVAPNSPTDAEDAHGTWYYRNTGTDAAPHFEFQRNDVLQGDMLDFGTGARPVLFDHNGDGLMDLVVANEYYFDEGGDHSGRLALLENTGTPTHPAFTLVTDDYAGLGSQGLGPSLHPAFGDVNGDGKPDMVLGNLAGNLLLYINSATGPVAQFTGTPALLSDDQGQVIDVGSNATPQLFDLDGDGLLDLVVGERNGNLNYYRNGGSSTVPAWHLETETLGGVSVNEYWSNVGFSVPFLYRDTTQAVILLSGSEVGGIYRYADINGNLNGAWTRTDSTWHHLQEGMRTAVAAYDFTNSGALSIIVGNYRGGLSFWATGATGSPAAIGEAVPPPFSLAPNPASAWADVLWHAPWAPGMRLDLLDGLGRVAFTAALRGPQARINLEGLPDGLYIVRIRDGVRQWTARLAVAR